MLVSGRVNEKKHRGPLFLENMSHLKAWILMAKECCLVLANHHLMRMDLDLCPSDSIATGTAQNLWPGTLWWYLFLIGFFCILLECSGKNRFQVCVFIYTCIYIYIYFIVCMQCCSTRSTLIQKNQTWGEILKSNVLKKPSEANPWTRSHEVMVHLFRYVRYVGVELMLGACLFFFLRPH